MTNSVRKTLILLFVFAIAHPAMAQTPTNEAVPAAPAPDAKAPADANAATPAAAPAAATPAPTAPAEATAADVPAPKASLLKTTKTGRYNLPLQFDPNESGILLPPPEIEYDLTQDESKTLKLGNLSFSEKTFVFVLRPLSAFNAQLGSLIGSEGAEPSLVIMWPSALLKSGTLEMISRSGQVLWKYEITPKAADAWQAKLKKWKQSLKERGLNEKQLRGGLFASQYAIEDLKKSGAPFWNQKETFRFCLTQVEGKMNTKLCSERFATRTTGPKLIMGKVPSSATPRVVVMNENGAMKGSVPVAADAPAQFYADLASGQSFEFLAMAPKLNLVDLADTSKPGLLRVSGYGVAPTGAHAILNPQKYGSLTTMLGFEPTIGDSRVFWAAGMKVDDPKLYFPGQGGGVFKQRFQLNDIPRSAARPHFDRDTMKGTYSEEPRIRGRKQPASTVSSEQNSATASADPNFFTWNFKAAEKGEINRAYMTVVHEGKTYKGFYELYRSYANELSGRFSGVVGASGMVFVGEVAYNHWFENLFGWDNAAFSTQRWGASFQYFKSLTNLKTGESTSASLDVMALNMKYRFTPGLWTRDETTGVMLSYQSVTFDAVKAPMLGVGAFWARSMPRVFDNLFNYLPFMEYPKWVDMEFIYFASSMSSSVTLDNTMALNFHGQVLWTKSFFGEAGFGYKRYGFNDSGQSLAAKLDTIYGTVGLGLKF